MCVKIRTYVCDVYVCLLLGLGGGLCIGFLLDGGLVIQLLFGLGFGFGGLLDLGHQLLLCVCVCQDSNIHTY